MYRRHKGQALSPDFLFSMSIFLVLVALSTVLWTSTYAKGSSAKGIEELSLKAVDISESLVRSPGVPTDWTNETASIIGLAEEDHLL